jgi:hypothetical protein
MTPMAGVVTIVAKEGRETDLLAALEELRSEVDARRGPVRSATSSGC